MYIDGSLIPKYIDGSQIPMYIDGSQIPMYINGSQIPVYIDGSQIPMYILRNALLLYGNSWLETKFCLEFFFYKSQPIQKNTTVVLQSSTIKI